MLQVSGTMAKYCQDVPDSGTLGVVAAHEHLGEGRYRWPDERKGPLEITLHWALVDGRAECVGVTVMRGVFFHTSAFEYRDLLDTGAIAARGAGLKATDLRLPVADFIERDRAKIVARFSGEWDDRQQEWWAGAGAVRGGPTYAAIAQTYSSAWARGEHPTAAVASEFGVSKSTAAKWVAKCRERGLLAPTERGRAGGVPKPSRRKSR